MSSRYDSVTGLLRKINQVLFVQSDTSEGRLSEIAQILYYYLTLGRNILFSAFTQLSDDFK